MTNEQMNFINKVAPILQSEGKRRGYNIISVPIAQAILESNWGKSGLTVKAHNFHGMKCGSKWKGKSINMKTQEEYTVGNLTTIRDNFRAYDNDEQGLRGYYDFISSSRYANLKTATTVQEYAHNLKTDGYFTSSHMEQSLQKVVATYGLERYDTETDVKVVVDKSQLVAPVTIKTTTNLNLRIEPKVDTKSLLVIPRGAEVQIDTDVFIPVIYNGKKGYVSAKYLNVKGGKYVW